MLEIFGQKAAVFALDTQPHLPLLREAVQLAKSAGAEVVLTGVSHRSERSAASYFTKGKLEEFAASAQTGGVDLVILANDVSPSQLSALIDVFGVPVLDRSMLILEMFRQRATSDFGKMKVELATLTYMLPRLRGAHDNLDRQRGSSGGHGARGKGEQKLELDRRAVRARMDRLRERIEKRSRVEHEKSKQRRESATPIISLVGYSNVGKSTLLNQMLRLAGAPDEKHVYADDRLFATLDAESRCVKLPHGRSVIVADTVGLIRDLPSSLEDAFASTFEEIGYADLILCVRDAQEEDVETSRRAIGHILERYASADAAVMDVVNKADGLSRPPLDAGDTIYISARCAEDVKRLLRCIERKLFGEATCSREMIPYSAASPADYRSNADVRVQMGEEGLERMVTRYSGGTFRPQGVDA